MPMTEELIVNDEAIRVEVDGARSLLSVLREDLELTGTKYGCGEGQCGACTVLIDGVATRSCNLPVSAVGGRKITTIEGLGEGDQLHPVQEAFLEADALQCGYCTCGMILAATALLRRNPNPSEEQIVKGMNGNLCRCGTYRRIITAVQSAAKQTQKEAV